MYKVFSTQKTTKQKKPVFSKHDILVDTGKYSRIAKLFESMRDFTGAAKAWEQAEEWLKAAKAWEKSNWTYYAARAYERVGRIRKAINLYAQTSCEHDAERCKKMIKK